VLIPESNIKHLMLRAEVIEAVRDNKFHVYAVATIDQGIALLTGRDAGEKQEDGTYPEGTVNQAVQTKILELAGKFRWFSGGGNGDETGSSSSI
jgi:predicted ATP-dependent protease